MSAGYWVTPLLLDARDNPLRNAEWLGRNGAASAWRPEGEADDSALSDALAYAIESSGDARAPGRVPTDLPMGLLTCGVCGRRLSIQLSKGRYAYFYCLGQKEPPCAVGMPRGVSAGRGRRATGRGAVPQGATPGRDDRASRRDMGAEVLARQERNAAEREFLARRLARAETERRRLLDAYYGGAVDLPTLRTEQERIGREIRAVEGQMEAANAHLEEWQEVLRLAAQIAGTCAAAYARASEKTRRLFNNAVFEGVLVRDGKVAEATFREPFDLLFSPRRFEYGDLAGERGFEPRIWA
jgi:hypothetical protein